MAQFGQSRNFDSKNSPSILPVSFVVPDPTRLAAVAHRDTDICYKVTLFAYTLSSILPMPFVVRYPTRLALVTHRDTDLCPNLAQVGILDSENSSSILPMPFVVRAPTRLTAVAHCDTDIWPNLAKVGISTRNIHLASSPCPLWCQTLRALLPSPIVTPTYAIRSLYLPTHSHRVLQEAIMLWVLAS
ncbi:hypothetical protein C8R44DRAFT_892771 [Mycena epipterygia]|nr:hypothetical protein C8R44DRAFT_892771 [Mycena epipterygia]